MITLRIIFTGLMLYGPVGGIGDGTTEMWALMVDATNHHHVTQLRYGCNGDASHCANPSVDLAGYDLVLYIDGAPLVGNAPIKIDHTFRDTVPNVAEMTGGAAGHLN